MTESSAPPRPVAPLDLVAERREVGAALEEAVLEVLHSGQYVLGPQVERFERSFAEMHGVAHGIGVASGTDALIYTLLALGVGPGTSVVTSPFTFFASAGSIALLGARVLLADVDPDTGLVVPELVERAIEDDTVGLLPVHLYGQLADVSALGVLAEARGLFMLEDGAQAHGARRDGFACGGRGTAGTFSFYPTKNLGAAGEGGLVATNDDELATKVRQLRDHGSPSKYRHARVGGNSRLQAMQAAVLNAKLPHLAGWNERRRANAAIYDAAFADSEHVRPLRREPNVEHVYHQYAVRIPGPVGRDAVAAALAEAGIGAAVHYPVAVHQQPVAADWGYAPGDLPGAETLAREVLCLPVHPFLPREDIERVAAEILKRAAG